MHEEKLQNWLDGKYVSPPEFKESLKAVLERVKWLEMAYENTGSIMNRRHQIDRIGRLEKEIKDIKREIEQAFDNWALGNFDDERFHIEIQLMVHKFHNS